MKKSAIPTVCAVLLAATSLLAVAEDPAEIRLNEALLAPELWSKPSEAVASELLPLGFVPTSSTADSLRAARKGLSFAGKPVYEAILRFQDGKAVEVALIFYNRGDAGELGRSAFEALLGGLESDLTSLFGSQSQSRGRDASSAVRAEGVVWKTKAQDAVLEWSAVKASPAKSIPFRAEFVRLILSPPLAGGAPKVGATPPPKVSDIVKAFSGRDKVRKDPGGDVVIDGIPMVDQGQKGYCVVASVERVMRYFGAGVDQHELAQIADTETKGGTSPSAMVESLKKLTMRLGVRVKEVVPFEFRDFLELVEDYNRAAKRAKAPEVNLGGQVVDIAACYRQMKPEILRDVRLKKAADFGRFQREIQKSIDAGIPLLWSVQLGIVPEAEIPQASGGHMRLVIGYNTQTKELLYSDSWGIGHEVKRMAIDDAWVITSDLLLVQPSGT